jgi:hypothetical protein
MTSNILQNESLELSALSAKFRNWIWSIGVISWLFGITDRIMSGFADGSLSSIELAHLVTTICLCASWVYLKPETSLNSGGVERLQSYLETKPKAVDLEACQALARMSELQSQHLISQEYILPFPYHCQIYHLLNLKHLESVHSFSLNNLKILKVSEFQATAIGARVKFQTILDSPINALRIWRQPIVEVELILHNPYTVELCIPAYNNKTINVIFNAVPISPTEHKFSIDIYSDLDWPRPILQFVLHFASCLTLFEDLPYLSKLSEHNIQKLFNLNKSNQETMWMLRRFIELYGSQLEPNQSILEGV